MANNDNKYFAALPASEAAGIVLGKVTSWINSLDSNGYMEKLKRSWAQYHGARYGDVTSGHKIHFTGEQGELAEISINHYRNIAQNMLVMTTSNRPAMDARAINTDYKSLVQTQLANGLLDYYLREKRLESYLKNAIEYAVVLGSGYIKMEWNSKSGDIYDFNEETGVPIYQGDVEFTNLSPFDVIFDASKETQDHDWIACRSFKNRFDLVAKYPEYESEILKLPTKTASDNKFTTSFGYNDTDDVAIFEFFHRRTESMPNGRYMLIISSKAVPIDGPLPYRKLPIYRVAPANILGTPFGYTPLFDLLSPQEAVDSLYSTILTNQSAFGVQNIWVPRGSDVAVNQLGGGLNIIEGNAQMGKPEPLNLTATPPEIFSFLQSLEKSMEIISGVNSVARGNPEASLKSGAALALVQSMTLQFMSGLQQEYVKLMEDVGSGLIEMLKDFASVPRVALIVGKHNRAFMREFKGEDLQSINRVVVDVANPLSKTTAGRVEMANQMMQMGLIKNPQDYIAVINTGNLNVMTEDTFSDLMLIRGENEKMARGESVRALAIDDHSLHIKEHKSVLSDPDLRNDDELTSVVLNHIQEHIQLMRTTDPDLLAVLEIQSLAPQQAQQGNPQEMPNEGQGFVGQNIQTEPRGDQIIGPGMESPVNIPVPPSPPAPFENLPTNPQNIIPS